MLRGHHHWPTVASPARTADPACPRRTGNSHELSLVSSSSGISDRFRLFADFVTIEPGWRLFQVELCPEELSEPGGAGGSGVRVQQISRLLTANGVSIYYTWCVGSFTLMRDGGAS